MAELIKFEETVSYLLARVTTAFRNSLERQMGQKIFIMGAETGLHLTLGLKEANDKLVSGAALRRGIVARPLSGYYDNPATAPNGLVLGYGGVADEVISLAVSKLASALHDA